MARLSVNINKVALLRNSRGEGLPDLLQVAEDCEAFGAQGITVHPRPDERHIHYEDVRALKPLVKHELNVEGYPSRNLLDLVLAAKPHQVTLVPDPPDALTSSSGWDTVADQAFLKPVIRELQQADIRTSIFLNAAPRMAEAAPDTGADRIELYTGPYADRYAENRSEGIAPFIETARTAADKGLGINAGHDLNLENLQYLHQQLPGLLEVSIGHALICDALYYGLENTIQLYRNQLRS